MVISTVDEEGVELDGAVSPWVGWEAYALTGACLLESVDCAAHAANPNNKTNIVVTCKILVLIFLQFFLGLLRRRVRDSTNHY